MWAEESVFYQIYPLGFCGAPRENDGKTLPRIRKLIDWIPHLKRLNVNALYLSPVFESDRHGYDVRDYRKIDCRLGSNEDFEEVCRRLKESGIRIVLDGVFHHVGRGFWAFQDVRRHRENSRNKDWFCLNFHSDSAYHDGFFYEGWEGHYELVKLNLDNPEVADYLFSAVRFWVECFGIDGLRLDVAYCLNENFIRRLRQFTDSLKPDFFLVGEILFGDYKRIVGEDKLHSCTNYECYKGLYSSFNDLNLFEIAHSLNRQFGNDGYALYPGAHLLSFADNHDVTRVASMLSEPRHLALLYGLLFAMPGIPCLYYGSEWGITGKKEKGDDAPLRPALDAPVWNSLTEHISRLAAIHRQNAALLYGSYQSILLTNRQFVFQRALDGERILVAVNADASEYRAALSGVRAENAVDLLTEERVRLADGCVLAPYSLAYWKLEA